MNTGLASELAICVDKAFRYFCIHTLAFSSVYIFVNSTFQIYLALHKSAYVFHVFDTAHKATYFNGEVKTL